VKVAVKSALRVWCPKTRSWFPSIIQRSRASCRLMAEERG
jgi:hypothetical protein